MLTLMNERKRFSNRAVPTRSAAAAPSLSSSSSPPSVYVLSVMRARGCDEVEYDCWRNSEMAVSVEGGTMRRMSASVSNP